MAITSYDIGSIIFLGLFFRELAEEELKTNIAQSEVFVLPSGQEIEKENILFKKPFLLFVIFHIFYHNPFYNKCKSLIM